MSKRQTNRFGQAIQLFSAIALVLLVWQLAMPDEFFMGNARPSARDATWKLLQQGSPGYVVMMRHAEAPGTGDPANFRLGDCATQRNLSGSGRAQAARIGQAFRSRKILVARVLSSQWCRCLETARLLALGKVEPFSALNSFFQNSSPEPKQTAAIRQFIVNNRNTPGLIILVTHQVNITALTKIVPRSGESVVLKADSKGRVEVVGRLNE
ncbi:histidine phosphatase family protein [Kovacikia minuta CCNUW1]|uniref:histidine phosphatase family protein n=1 Tax=Kovacikia minuta TaxID=2931930 RepID=UPI001CC9BC46|nr:histidine phosphatase family protein [Kovacikia minuta]UBF26364.1 histidine phosphatase family protein [Kovacikia minuta CCNUW1]